MSTKSETGSTVRSVKPTGTKLPTSQAPTKVLTTPMKRYPAPPETAKVAHTRPSSVSAPMPGQAGVMMPTRRPQTPPVMTPPAIPNETGKFFQNTQTLLGFGDREYAFGMFPRGYGMTLLAITGCYSLLRWERNRLKRNKHNPPTVKTNAWFAKLKTIEKAYSQARNDFPRTVVLTLIGGLGMPYAAAVGALFWCAGRAVDFHEAEENKPGAKVENTEAVLCRFGKFLMICGMCKFAFDFTRGRINLPLTS